MMIDLYFDLDGTLAYFNNNIECFEVLLEENYFYNLTPIDNVVKCMKSLISLEDDINIYILSSCINDDTRLQKDRWIDKYIPQIPKENRIFTKLEDNKKDFVVNKNNLNILIDDYNKNLNSFHDNDKFIAVKLVNDINDLNGSWQGERLYYNHSPFSIMQDIKKIVFNEMCKLHGINSIYSIHDKIKNVKNTTNKDTKPLDQAKQMKKTKDLSSKER